MIFNEKTYGVVAYIASYIDRSMRMVTPHDQYLLLESTEDLTRLIQEAMYKDVHVLIYFVAKGEIVYQMVVPETCLKADIDDVELPLQFDVLEAEDTQEEDLVEEPREFKHIEEIRPWTYRDLL